MLKKQRTSGKTLNYGVEKPSVSVTRNKWNVENILGKPQPNISVSEHVAKVINHEFEKIKTSRNR